MGYNTKYELKIEEIGKEDLKKIRKATIWDGDLPLSELMDGGYECKWYGHDDDMRLLSTRFPTAVFALHGDGEESGDMWVKYYKDGKCQEAYAEIVFEEYDEEKLK